MYIDQALYFHNPTAKEASPLRLWAGLVSMDSHFNWWPHSHTPPATHPSIILLSPGGGGGGKGSDIASSFHGHCVGSPFTLWPGNEVRGSQPVEPFL